MEAMKHNKVLSLSKVFLKNSFQNMRSANSQDTGKKKNKMGMMVFTIIAFIYLAGVLGFVSYGMIRTLVAVHQEQLFLGMLLLGMALLLVFQSIFTSLNVLYFSKDIEHVLPLPLKPWEIIMAKMNVMLVTEYITEMIFLLVPLILYGILTGAGILFYGVMVIVLLLFPIVPILLTSFLMMIFMSFAKITKNRDSFQVIASVIAIIMVLVMSLFMNSNQEPTEEQMLEMLMQANGVATQIGNYFITLNPAIYALSASSLGVALWELLKIVLITGILYLAFLLVSQKLYLRGAVGNTVGASKKTKKLKGTGIYRKHSIGISYVVKEIKILIRNPIFLMQCVLPAILMPILFGIIVLSSLGGMEGMETEIGLETMDANNTVVVCFALGAMQFFSMMIYVAATAFSRDGENATWVKYAPISLTKQFTYKVIPNVLVSMAMITMITIALGVVTKMNLVLLAFILIMGILFSIIQSFLMGMVDLKKPKLQWETEYAVVKQNMNLMWPMLLGLTNIIFLVIFGIVFSGIAAWISSVVLTVILGAVIYFLYHYIEKNELKLFKNIY